MLMYLIQKSNKTCSRSFSVIETFILMPKVLKMILQKYNKHIIQLLQIVHFGGLVY